MTDMMNENKEQPTLNIQRIYRQASSFEIFNFPESFKQAFQPENQLQINIQTNALEQDAYEVVLNLDVSIKHQDKILFKGLLKQAGIFTIKNITGDQLQQALLIACPQILFPYAKEAVANMTQQATLPPLYLMPLNFEAIYLQQQAQQKEQHEQATATH